MDKSKSRVASWEEDVGEAAGCRLGWGVGEQGLRGQGRKGGHSRRDRSHLGRAGGWEEEGQRERIGWLAGKVLGRVKRDRVKRESQEIESRDRVKRDRVRKSIRERVRKKRSLRVLQKLEKNAR